MKITAGLNVEIIYEDGSGNITQRKIAVRGVRDGVIRATDLNSSQPRTFKVTNILAWSPISQTA
ncbi:hypothetical protein [Paenibacillus massiliensis]|uniref:hypothetical protein n=1 Tax=Paenibacillus massiliensis TaxID=225917 RepID=UPI001CF78B64|nr:hypothetical protein [Paenibacillus massiliensis]